MKSFFKHMLFALVALGSATAANAAAVGPLPYQYQPDAGNLPSLQRGARNYMAYCAACHSMKHLRYSRIGQDLGIPDDLLQSSLMFNTDRPGDTIQAGMPPASADWFGQAPPDLSLTVRARTPSWVYSYLMSFYLDPSRPLGVNNTVLEGASMPHVLWELQGWQVKDEEAKHGLRLQTEGSMSPQEYARFVGDTVNFMAYASEPGKAARQSLGLKVMLFLILFTILAYLLKREYWRDVH